MGHRRSRGLMLLLLAAALFGCGAMGASNKSEAPAADMDAGMPGGSAPAPEEAESEASWEEATDTTGVTLADDLPRMIIYTGNLVLVVKDSGAAQVDAVAIAEGAGGYVAGSDSYTYGDGLRRINLTLRVPAESFNATMDALRDLSIEVTEDAISSQDVTQEYVDLESRLKALEVKAARLEELMDEAEDTEAVLAVYEELSRTQIEIEETKGRMRYLERQSAMATISVTLVPDELSRPMEIAGWRPQGTVKRAVETLVSAFQFLVDALIWIVLVVVPVLAFVGLVIFGAVRLLGLIFGRGRRRRRAQEAAKSPETTEG
jgi:hypothetical protein